MKKTIALCLVLVLLILGSSVYLHQKHRPPVNDSTTERSTTTYILTTAKHSSTTETTNEKDDNTKDGAYTKKQIQQILYDYAAEYSYNPDVYHSDVSNFIMRQDGMGAAVFADKQSSEKSLSSVFVYTTKDYGNSWEVVKQIFDCEENSFNLIYINGSVILLDGSGNQNESYVFFSDNNGKSFESVKTSSLLAHEDDALPALYPELIGCDYEDESFLLGWKASKDEDAKYCLFTKHDALLKNSQTVFKDKTVLTAVEITDGKTIYPYIEDSGSYTAENCFQGLTVLKNYALGRPVTQGIKEFILHYTMNEDGKGVAIYGEHGGMQHIYASILYTEDFGNTWQVSNESFNYLVGESEMLLIDDKLIFLNYNSVTFSSEIRLSTDYGKTFKTVLLSDLLGYKGAVAMSLYPEVKEVDEKNKTFTVDWHSITDKKVLLTQKYDLALNVIETPLKNDKAIDTLITENGF